jgi:hypothetical protein
VIAGRVRGYVTAAAALREAGYGIAGAAKLERARALQILALAVKVARDGLVEVRIVDDRRHARLRSNARMGQVDVGEIG